MPQSGQENITNRQVIYQATAKRFDPEEGNMRIEEIGSDAGV